MATNTPAHPEPGANWRFALAIGLPIGVAIPTSRGVTEGLEPSLGHWGAFLVKLGRGRDAGGVDGVGGIPAARPGDGPLTPNPALAADGGGT